MRTVRFPKTNIRVLRLLRWWGVLCSICIFGTILVANAYLLIWIGLWPAAFSVVPVAVFLFYFSLLSFRLLGALIDAYIASFNLRLDDLSHEIGELKRDVEQVGGKVRVHTMSRSIPIRLM